MNVTLVLFLILLNGIFALSEIAIVSSRRARLARMADAGSRGADRAIALAAEPTRFLSTVQVGITAIGILNGAIGEAALAAPIRERLSLFPALAPYADELAFGLIVIVLTYFSLIFGELVPKRIALLAPERLAAAIALPMEGLARVGRPIVAVLSASTDAVLRLLRIGTVKQPAVTPEEIKVLLEEATREGVFEPSEQ